jgi:glycerophosphoryl diester phosphodiesterase
VQLSRDGTLIVFHDYLLKPELCRHSDGTWLSRGKPRLIRELNASELQEFDIGRIKPRTLYAQRHRVLNPQDGERIPLLSQVIAAVRESRSDFKLFIEIKTCAEDRSLSAPPEEVAKALVTELRRTGYLGHAVLVGFDWAALLHAKTLAPDIPCWLTTKRRAPRANRAWAAGFHPSKFGGSIARAVASAGGDGWLSARAQATGSRIEEARGLGLKVGVWTVNDVRSMRSFQRLGVDAIVTDRPDRMAVLE